MITTINRYVIMSDASQFASTGLNPLSSTTDSVDSERANLDHQLIRDAFTLAGIEIRQVDAPPASPDGVYSANWGLCIGDTVVFSKLPNERASEEPYVHNLFSVDPELVATYTRQIVPPYLFSGQGDALVCGNYLFCGQGYRTDPRMHPYLAELFPTLNIISLQTIPALDEAGIPKINPITGLAESFFYDLDLALSVISPDTIAWCPEAFLPASQEIIRGITDLTKIEVSYDEAVNRFASNLVSTGNTVVMSSGAPKLQRALEALGLTTITPDIRELTKGGGFIRCVSLTITQ
jgi:N-dimethylarginine dimethylaminohydrolase